MIGLTAQRFGLLLLSTFFVLLGLLYEGRHLSLSVRRKITVNLFLFNVYKLFIYFCQGFNVFNFFYFGETFFHLWYSVCLDVSYTAREHGYRVYRPLRSLVCLYNAVSRVQVRHHAPVRCWRCCGFMRLRLHWSTPTLVNCCFRTAFLLTHVCDCDDWKY